MVQFVKKAVLGAALAATTLTSITPAMAQDYRGDGGRRHGNGDGAAIAVGVGIIGLAIAAAAASGGNKKRRHHRGYDERYRDYCSNDGYYRDRNRDGYRDGYRDRDDYYRGDRYDDRDRDCDRYRNSDRYYDRRGYRGY